MNVDPQGTFKFFWKYIKEALSDASVFDKIKLAMLFIVALFLWTSVCIFLIKLF